MQHPIADVPKPFLDHLSELRTRLFWVIFVVTLGAVVGYQLRAQLIALLLAPLGSTIYYTSPTGGFDLVFTLCLVFGFLVALPVSLYQLIRFLAPAFPPNTLPHAVAVAASSLLLALTGICIAYFLGLPAALHFLSGFGSTRVKSLLSADAYISFVFGYLLAFGILFQLPLLLLLVNRLHQLSARTLFLQQRYVILLSFVAAAVLTPTPDPLNQTVMALPLIGLYEVSVCLIFLVNRTRRPRYQSTRRRT